MVRTAEWPAPVPAPSRLGTVNLIGDVQTEWESPMLNPLSGNSNYDLIGRDNRDRLIGQIGAERFQMGDLSDEDANDDPVLLRRRFQLFDAWVAKYGLGTMHKVMGNHDVIDGMMTPREWALFMGYPSQTYAVDLPGIRVVCIGPSASTMKPPAGWVDSGTKGGIRPMSDADVAAVDTILRQAPSVPTIVLNHAPFASQPSAFSTTQWWSNQSTVASGISAGNLRAVLEANTQVVAWGNGHTHSPYYDIADPNLSTLTVGARKIAAVDAGACFTQPPSAGREVGRGMAVTVFVSIMDDGRTVEARWRDHGARAWVSVGASPVAWRFKAT